MAFDPESPNDLARLKSAIDDSIVGLEAYRANYAHLRLVLADPCHKRWPVKVEDRQVVNKEDELFTILTRAVVSRNPTLRIGTESLSRIAGMLKTQLEDWGERNDMAAKLRDAFHEMLLRWAIGHMSVKVKGGEPYEPQLNILDFEDYFIDLRQTDEALIDFEGHEFEVFRDELSDSSLYDQGAVREMGDAPRGFDGDYVGRRLYDRVKVRLCWLPLERLLLTLPAHAGTRALRIQRYAGPPEGPYIRECLKKRRGAIVPVSYASGLLDKHDFCNVSWKQVFMQSDGFSEFFLVDSQFEQVADIHRTAEYGHYYTVDNVNAVKRETKGGVNQGTILAAMQANDMFNEAAGNLRLLSGQSSGEPTARQAAQLGTGIDQMVRDCRTALNRFARKVYQQAAWYMMNEDPGVVPVRQVEWTDGAGIKDRQDWIPGVGKVLPEGDLKLDVIPDSMIERTSQEQAVALLDSVRTIAQLLAVPGNKPVFLDHQELVEQIRTLSNQPELNKLFGQAPDVGSLVPGSETAGAAASANRGANSPSGGRMPADRLKEKLMFQAIQPAQEGG